MKKKRGKHRQIYLLMMMTIIMTLNITYADLAAPQSNEDAPSAWAIKDIDKAIEVKLLPEKLQGKYRENITREEFSEVAVSLYKALKGQAIAVKDENPFTDTQNRNVIEAYNLGIVKGVGEDKFAPENAITRQEISVMLYQTLKAAKPNYDYRISSRHVFADNSTIDSWAKEAVSYLYGIEVVNGTGANQFNPKANTAREEAIALAVRIYDKASAAKDTIVVTRGSTSRGDSSMQLALAKLIAPELGKPYQWGGTGPAGYDCSGLVYSIYGKLGIALPRVSRDQATAGTYVAKEDLIYGDLVFFARDGRNINHVGIYIGEGMMVHSPESGDVVKKTTIMSGYYERSYYTARRVLK